MNPRGSSGDSGSGAEERRLREQLPWHAAGAPGTADDAVIRGLADGGKADSMVQAELAWWQSTAVLLRSAPPVPRELEDQGLDLLMDRIAAESAAPIERLRPLQQPALSPLQRIGRAALQTLAAPPRALVAGLALLVAVQAALLAGLLATDAGLHALGGESTDASRPAGMVVLTVAFRPDVQEAALRRALQEVQAEIVAGPSALGLYWVAVPATRADEVHAHLLRAVSVIESIQP